MAGNLVIKITGDDSDFASTLNGLRSKASSAFNGIGKAMAILTGTFSAVKGVVMGVGVAYNAQIENLQTSFEVMTGSAERAGKIVSEVKRIAAETPYETTGLARVTQLLMNYGIEAETALDNMSMLGDIAQGSTEKMLGIGLAYGQMSSAGKVHLQDIKQMIGQGFNPLQEISETTGESMESLYKRIEKGTISVDEIKAAMQRSVSEGGKYYKSMEKQALTFNGLLSTLKDDTVDFIGELVKPVSAGLQSSLLPQAIELVGQLRKAYDAGGFEGLIDEVSTFAPKLLEQGTELVMNLVRGMVKGLPVALKALSSALPGMLSTALTVTPELLSAVMDMLAQFVGSIIEQLPTLVPILLEGVVNTIEAVANGAMSLIGMVLDGLFGALGLRIETFDSALESAFDRVDKDRVSKVTETIQKTVNQETTINPEVVITTSGVISTKVDEWYADIYAAFSEGRMPNQGEVDAANKRVNDGVDQILNGIEVDKKAKIAELDKQLEEGKVSAEKYAAQYMAIIQQAETAKSSIITLKTEVDAYLKQLEEQGDETATESVSKLSSLTSDLQTEIDKFTGEGGVSLAPIDTFLKDFHDKVAAGVTFSGDDITAYKTSIEELVKGAIAAIDLQYDTELSKLNADLQAGLIDTETYTTKYTALQEQANAAKVGLAELLGTSDAVLDSLTSDSDGKVGAAKSKFESFRVALVNTAAYVNRLPQILNVSSVFDIITTTLTDGKADSEEVISTLKDEVEKLYGGKIKEIEEWVNQEIGKLDTTSASYSTQVKQIQKDGAAMIQELKDLQAASLLFIDENAGKATDVVKGHLGKLNEIEQRAHEVTAAVNAAIAADEQLKANRRELVAGGGVPDNEAGEQLAAEVLANEKSTYDKKVAAAKAEYEKTLGELQTLYANDPAGYKAAAESLTSEFEAENAKLLAAYQNSLAELFAGITSSSPELQDKLSEPLEKLEVYNLWEAFKNELLTPGQEFSLNDGDFKKIADALGMDIEELNRRIWEAITDADSGLTPSLVNYGDGIIDGLLFDIMEIFSNPDFDFGTAGNILMGAIAAGLLKPFGEDNPLGIDDMKERFKFLLGELINEAYPDEKQEPTEPEIDVTPTPGDVTPTEGFVENVDQAVKDAVSDPVDVEKPINMTPGEVETPKPEAQPEPFEPKPLEFDMELSGEADGVVGEMSKIMAEAAKAANGFQNQARQIGENFVNAVGAGVRAGRSGVIQEIIAFAKAMVDQTNASLEISSPSKKGLAIGENYGGSIVAGASNALKGLGSFNLTGYAREALNSITNRPIIPGQQLDYNELARAMAERPTELYINSRKFAYATAADANNAITDRRATLLRARGR